MTSLLLQVIDDEMRVDDPHTWKRLRAVEREQRKATGPAIYPQNEITNSSSNTQLQSPPSTNTSQSPSSKSFKDLPEEVICMILAYLFGDEIESISIASGFVRNAMKWKYSKHKVLNKIWSRNSGGNAMSGIDGSHPLELLTVFLKNPRTASNIAMYPRRFQIEGCDERNQFDDPDDISHLATSLRREIAVAVRPSPRLSSEEKLDWSDQIRSCRQGPALALLVSILPGIQSLVLFDSMSVVQDLDPCSSRVADAYGRLSYVETGSTHSGYYENLNVLAQFIVVQSMRSFRGLRLSDTKFTSLSSTQKFHQEEKFRKVDKLISWPTNMNTYHTKSTITKLKLDGCALRTGSIHRILSSIQALEEFSYTCHWPNGTKKFKYSEWGGRGQWEPQKIVKILLQTAMTTLVSLDLTNIGEYCAQIGADYSMGNLRDFYKLRYIRVEYMMFVVDAPHDRWSSRVRSLLSVMPESLRCLSLAGPKFSAKDASAVLDFLAPRDIWEEVVEEEERDADAVFHIDKEVEGAENETGEMKKMPGSARLDHDENSNSHEHAEEGESRKKKNKKHSKQKAKKKAGGKKMSLQNLAKRLQGREKKLKSRESIDGDKEKGKSGKEKNKKGKEARRKKRELEEGEEQKRKKKEKAETDALMMEQRGFIPVLNSWQFGVPNLGKIIFENFDGDKWLRRLLARYRKGAEKRKIRLCEARLVTRPPLRVDDQDRVDDGEVAGDGNIVYEHEPMLVHVVNNHGGRSYHAWTEVWKSSDPSMPVALVTELFRGSRRNLSAEASTNASDTPSSTTPPTTIYPSLSSTPRVLLRTPPEESNGPSNTTAQAPASVTDLTHLTQSSAHITAADSSANDTDSVPPVNSASQIDPPRHLLARRYNWSVTDERFPAPPEPSNLPLKVLLLAAAARRAAQSSSSMQIGGLMAPSSRTPGSNTPLSTQREQLIDLSRPSTSSTTPPSSSAVQQDFDFKNPVEEYISEGDKSDGMLDADEVSGFEESDEEESDEEESDEEDGDEEDADEEDADEEDAEGTHSGVETVNTPTL